MESAAAQREEPEWDVVDTVRWSAQQRMWGPRYLKEGGG